MKKDCVFYHQKECRFKQKNASRSSCLFCGTYYKKVQDISLKEWYIVANTNRNFRRQMIMAISTLALSAYVVYDKQLTTKKIDVLQEKINKLSILSAKKGKDNKEKITSTSNLKVKVMHKNTKNKKIHKN